MNWKNLSLSAVSVMIVLLLVEAALRVANFPPSPNIAGWRWDESPYRAEFNMNDKQINQLGLRGATIEYGNDDFVVLLVGDSQTEAGTQPADKLPERLLAEALQKRFPSKKIKVFTVASAGWGQDQELVWLNRYFEHHRADLVLNWLTPVNDYWENTFVDRSSTREAGRLKPTFKSDGDALEPALPFPFDWKLKNLVALSLGRAANGKQFTLEQHYANKWQARLPSPQSPEAAASACPANEVPQGSLLASYFEGARAYTLTTDEDVEHGRSHFSPFLRHASPRDRYSVEITHRLMQEMANVSERHHAKFFMFHVYRSDLDAAFREIRCVKILPAGRYFEFDASDWLRHIKNSPVSKYLIAFSVSADHPINAAPGDWHFGEEGNRLSMDALAEALSDINLVPR
jgi:hypothetical protein